MAEATLASAASSAVTGSGTGRHRRLGSALFTTVTAPLTRPRHHQLLCVSEGRSSRGVLPGVEVQGPDLAVRLHLVALNGGHPACPKYSNSVKRSAVDRRARTHEH